MTCSTSKTKIFDDVFRDDRFDLELRKKVHHVFGAPIELRVALLTSESLHFGHGESAHAHVGEGFAHFVEFEGLDDGDNLLHTLSVPRALRGRRTAPNDFGGRPSNTMRVRPFGSEPPNTKRITSVLPWPVPRRARLRSWRGPDGRRDIRRATRPSREHRSAGRCWGCARRPSFHARR